MPLTHATRVEGYDAIRLRSASAHLDATFVPTAGMVGASLRDGGEELLGRGLGVHCYARGGTTMGIPLLHPWANRLAADEYRVNGTAVRLRPDSPLVARDEHGLPIHGLLGGSPHWALRHSNGNGNGRMGALGRDRLRRPSRAPRGVPVPPPPRARRRPAPAHPDRAHDPDRHRRTRRAGLLRLPSLPAPGRGRARGLARRAAGHAPPRSSTRARSRPARRGPSPRSRPAGRAHVRRRLRRRTPMARSSSSPAAGAASPCGSSRAIRPHRSSRRRPMTSSASSR